MLKRAIDRFSHHATSRSRNASLGGQQVRVAPSIEWRFGHVLAVAKHALIFLSCLLIGVMDNLAGEKALLCDGLRRGSRFTFVIGLANRYGYLYVNEAAEFGIDPHPIEWMRWISCLDPDAIHWVTT